MATFAVETRGLTMDYDVGSFRAKKHRGLDQLDLSVEEGSIFGLIGPNGAGKTTTLKILMGLIYPTAGEAKLLGKAVGDRGAKSQLGYLPEQPYFYDYLSGRELLLYFGALFGLESAERAKRADELLERVDMAHAANVPLRKYSKGMTQRVGIAQALINQPKLVLLDEPMSGLDPVGRREMSRLLKELRESGVSVFFCSHVLPDVEVLCDEVAILNRGRLIKKGRMDEILDMHTHTVEVVVENLDAGVENRVLEKARVSNRVGTRYRLEFSESAFAECLSDLHAGDGRLVSVNPVRQTLDDYFVEKLGDSHSQV